MFGSLGAHFAQFVGLGPPTSQVSARRHYWFWQYRVETGKEGLGSEDDYDLKNCSAASYLQPPPALPPRQPGPGDLGVLLARSESIQEMTYQRGFRDGVRGGYGKGVEDGCKKILMWAVAASVVGCLIARFFL